MKRNVWIACLLCALLPLHGFAKDLHGIVVSVSDGDTLVVRDGAAQTKVRLYGIDCPEYTQAFGKQARQFTSQLALSKSVRVNPRYKDDYGRLVANVYLPDGAYLNAQIVAAGYAWWFRKYAPHDTQLQKLEHEARIAKRGLWSDSNTPVEPWSFRHEEHPDEYLTTNSPIEISYLHCTGTGEKEPDEYVEIHNRSANSIDMAGWILHDERSNHSVRFPRGFRIAPGAKCKIYTNLNNGCLSFRETKTAVWNNGGDRAYLRDPKHQILATRNCDN